MRVDQGGVERVPDLAKNVMSARQCSMPGLVWNRVRRLTVNERSGRVASYPHITDLKSGRNGLLTISAT
jgi:hypothetical protein